MDKFYRLPSINMSLRVIYRALTCMSYHDQSLFVQSKDQDDVKETTPKKAKVENKEQQENVSNGTTAAKDFNFKICSWNVAGLRAWFKKNGLNHLKEDGADVVCLQETKCLENELPGEVASLGKGKKIIGDNKAGYHMYWNNGEKKGYSGVALWSKTKPIKVTNGLGIEEHDNEGRLITAEYEKFYLITSYVPNSGKKLIRLDYRREWNTAVKDYMKKLEEKKPVIFCGDLNVAHHEIDIANPKSNKRNAGFTVEERDDFTQLLSEGYFDSFRHLNPEKVGAYTYWTYMANARAKNVGWRLDYFVMSNKLKDNLSNSEIRSDVTGSDHCPIVLTLDI